MRGCGHLDTDFYGQHLEHTVAPSTLYPSWPSTETGVDTNRPPDPRFEAGPGERFDRNCPAFVAFFADVFSRNSKRPFDFRAEESVRCRDA